jgi:hypothetical protein
VETDQRVATSDFRGGKKERQIRGWRHPSSKGRSEGGDIQVPSSEVETDQRVATSEFQVPRWRQIREWRHPTSEAAKKKDRSEGGDIRVPRVDQRVATSEFRVPRWRQIRGWRHPSSEGRSEGSDIRVPSPEVATSESDVATAKESKTDQRWQAPIHTKSILSSNSVKIYLSKSTLRIKIGCTV